jgi:hypothetical protein
VTEQGAFTSSTGRSVEEGGRNGDPPSRRAVLRAGLMAGAGAAGLPLVTLVRGGTSVDDAGRVI